MLPGRVLLLLHDRSQLIEVQRALANRISVVVPNHSNSPELCISEGKYAVMLVSMSYAMRCRNEIRRAIDLAAVPFERILIYDREEWSQLSDVVENGLITRLIPHFWDAQTIAEMLVHYCDRDEANRTELRLQELAEKHIDKDVDELRSRVLDLEIQNRRLQALATTDGLTGLANRRELNEVISREISRASRFHTGLGFVMCDVDFFKHYNDNFGHPAGDEVLRGIAAIMRSRLRVSDVAARYGGEEFGLILPMTSKMAAFKVADSLRQRIEEHQFPHQEGQPNGNLTISMGVAHYPEDCVDAATLIDAADRALYHAKQTGRNRVTAFETAFEMKPEKG